MENELMNHVSNAVSSFLSMHEAKARHARGNSKSDIGFTNPGDYGQLECTNEYENEYIDTTLQSRDHHCLGNNVLTEYNGCNKDRKRGNHSTKRKKQVCFHQNNLKNQYSNDQSLYNTETQAEIFLNDMNKRHNSKPKHNEMFGQRSFSSRGPVISSHLMGLNKLMKRKVSPIQRDEVDRLMTSGNSIFES